MFHEPNHILIISSDEVIISIIRKVIMNNINNCKIFLYKSLFDVMKDKKLNYKIIITDGVVLGSSGCEIINYLRFTCKFLNTIIFLSRSTIETQKALVMGVNDIVEKPIVISDFLSVVQNNLK